MAVQIQSINGALQSYLDKWLAVATLENVVYDCQSYNTGDVVFKCKSCQTFFSFALVEFAGGQIPYALQEWVKQHRHNAPEKCPKFKIESYLGEGCSNCGRSYEEHEKAKVTWEQQALINAQKIKAQQELTAFAQVKQLPWSGGLPVKSGASIQIFQYGEALSTPPAPAPKPVLKPEPRGRRFRKPEPEE